MASSKEYLVFLLDQLSLVQDVKSRAMMGEYVLYAQDKVLGGIYDDRFLVKITPASQRLLPLARREFPYEGAKEMLLVGQVDDREFLRDLVEVMLPELPDRKKKTKEREPCRSKK